MSAALRQLIENSAWGGLLAAALLAARLVWSHLSWSRRRPDDASPPRAWLGWTPGVWLLGAAWGLVLARLLLPASPPAPFSLLNTQHAVGLGPAPSPAPAAPAPPIRVVEVASGRVLEVRPDAVITGARAAAGGASSSPAGPPRGLAGWTQSGLLGLVWLGGAGVVGGLIALGHWRALRVVRGARQFSDARVIDHFQRAREAMGVGEVVTIAESAAAPGPMLVGVIRPAVIVPRGLAERLDDEALELVLRHELAHVRRKDILVSWLWAVATLVHWFNPLVWLAAGAARADREVACDACVLASLQRARRPAYGRALLDVLEASAPAPIATGLAAIIDSSEDLKRRITMIMSFTPGTRAGLLSGLTLVLAIGAATLTAAQPARPAPNPAISERAIAGQGPEAQADLSERGEHRVFTPGRPSRPAADPLVIEGDLRFTIAAPKPDDARRRIEVALMNGEAPVLRSLIPTWQARFLRAQLREALERAGGKGRERATRALVALGDAAPGAGGEVLIPGRASLQALPQQGSDPAELRVVLYHVDRNQTPLDVQVGPGAMKGLLAELTAAMDKAGIPLAWEEVPQGPAGPVQDARGEDRFTFSLANRPAKGGWIVLPGTTTITPAARPGGGLVLAFTDPEPGAPGRTPVTLELSPALARTFATQLESAASVKVDLEGEAAKLAERLKMSKEKALEAIKADEAKRSGPIVVNISPRTLRPDGSGNLSATGQELSVRPPGAEGSVDITRVGIMISPIRAAPNSGGCTMIAYVTRDAARELLKGCLAAMKK